MSKYLSFFYWFNSRPEQLGATGRQILFGIAILCALILIIVSVKLYKKFFHLSKPFISSILWFASLNLIVALAMWFVDYELIPFFRAHFWYILWVIVDIIWIIELIRLHLANRHEVPVISEREQEIKKYLP